MFCVVENCKKMSHMILIYRAIQESSELCGYNNDAIMGIKQIPYIYF
jgi:hypothetical protein